MMWYHVICLTISISRFYWMSLARVLKHSIDMTKMSSTVVVIRSFHNISISTQWSSNNDNVCQKQDGFYFKWHFFINFWIHISQISQIYTPLAEIQSQHLKRYVTTCFHIQSRIILSISLGYVHAFFFLVCGNCPLSLKMGMCWNIL